MRLLVLLMIALSALGIAGPAHALVVLGWHDVRDRIEDGESDASAISTRNLAMQLDWLRAHGYVPVSAQAVRDAQAGRATLPQRAVLLTFAGGHRSAYTHVFPLLRAFRVPALVAVPTSRLGAAGADSAGVNLQAADLAAMQASGLVEFATQGHELATTVVATPQGDRLPASTARRWAGSYESEADYRERLRRDLATSADLLQRATGRRPQAVVWPAGGGSPAARVVAQSLGMPLVLDAEGRSGTGDIRFAGRMRLDDEAMRAARLVAFENPGANDLAYEMRRDIRLDGLRAVRVRLDGIVGADDATTRRNIAALVERIRGIRPSHVFLQALSDADADGRADGAYFPTAHLPVRSDVFAHAAARLSERAGVQVFGWLPADATALAEDLAVAAPVAGLVFDDAAPGAPTAPTGLRAAPWRPGLLTVRAVDATSSNGAALAAALPALASGHDFVAVMLPHDPRGSHGRVDRIVEEVAKAPEGLDRTVFVIDAGNAARPLPAAELEAQTRRVIARGGRHVAYAGDEPLKDHPPLDPARAAISARAFPYLER